MANANTYCKGWTISYTKVWIRAVTRGRKFIIIIQLLILFLGRVTYLEPKLFLFIIFYNGTLLIVKILILFKIIVVRALI
jgi:hypothetical protein